MNEHSRVFSSRRLKKLVCSRKTIDNKEIVNESLAVAWVGFSGKFNFSHFSNTNTNYNIIETAKYRIEKWSDWYFGGFHLKTFHINLSQNRWCAKACCFYCYGKLIKKKWQKASNKGFSKENDDATVVSLLQFPFNSMTIQRKIYFDLSASKQ